MASRKEYEMLFRLDAQLGSNYNSTFSSAQKAVLAMEKELGALGKVKADISAFQKQQEAIEATKNKLVVLQQQYDNIQKELQETGDSSSALKNKLLDKQQQIDRTTASLGKMTQNLQQLGSALESAGVDTENLEKESARLDSQMADLRSQQKQAANGAQEFGESSTRAFEAIQDAIAAAGIAAALHEIYSAYMECVTVAGNFEASMSNVEALSGATAEEMNALSSEAKELGATTKFTAKESADAMGYMAMAGWDAAEMLSGMDGVLQLAAASGEDLALVSDIVTDNLTAFGLTAADTAHFSDVLAAAATNSNTSVAVMGETFRNSASVAGALGYSINDVAIAVGLMANAGTKGSRAGTALRNIFGGLLDGVTLTSAAFGEVEYSAVKADGTMASFSETIDDLRGYFNQMTEAEKVSNATVLAGERGYTGLLAILNATDEDYASLAASINNCSGEAAKMAAIKMNNMNGQLALLKSAWEAVETTVGEQFTPTMQDAYGAGADVLTEVNKFLQAHPTLVKAVATFGGVLGSAVAALTAFAAITKVVIPLMQLFTSSIPGVGIILGAITGVAALTAGIVALTSAADDGRPSLEELTASATEMNKTLEDASAAYDDTVASTLAAANVANNYIDKLDEMGDYTSLSAEEQLKYRNILTLISETVPELSGLIDVQNGYIEGGTAALRANTDAWMRNAKAQAYQDQLTEMYRAQADVLLEAEKNQVRLTEAQVKGENAANARAAAEARMHEIEARARADAEKANKELGSQFYNYLNCLGEESDEYYRLSDAIAQYDVEIHAAQAEAAEYEAAIQADAEAVNAAEAEIAETEEAVNRLTAALGEGEQTVDSTIEQQQALQESVNSVFASVEELTNAYTEAYDAAFDSVNGQYQLWDSAAEVVATSADTINEALSSQVTYWQDYNANLQSLMDRASGIDGLSDMIASFADGSAESVNAIAGLASANTSDEDLAAIVANWQLLQDEQGAVSDSLAEMATHYTDEMDRLQEQIAADVNAMDFGAEAAESAMATIQGFIDGAIGMQPQVEEAYAKIAEAAMNAIDAKLKIHSPSRVMHEKAEMTWAGYIQGTEDQEPEVQAVMANTAGYAVDAVPTDGAMTSAISAEPIAASEASTYVVTFSPVYNITGTENAAELEALLKEHDQELYQKFSEWMAEIGADEKRTAYR